MEKENGEERLLIIGILKLKHKVKDKRICFLSKITAIPEEPFNNKVGSRAGSSDGSFCELSKFGTKSTCNITEINPWSCELQKPLKYDQAVTQQKILTVS